MVLATTEELEGFVDVLVEVGLVRHKELLVDGVLFDDHSCDLAGVSLTHESDDGSVHSIADHLLKLLRILNICEERHVEVRLLDGETGLLLLLLVGHGHGLRHGSLLRHLDLLLLIHGLLLVVVLSTLLAALVVVSTAGRTVVATTTASIIVISAALVAATVVAAVAVVVVVVLAALTVVIVKLVLLLRGVVAIALGGLVILLVVLGV